MRRKGSVTVFAALSLMLVAQLVFTLLEAARHCELQKVLAMHTDTALESVFADYCSPLWKTYRILGMTADDTDGTLSFNRREAELRELTAEALGSSKGKLGGFGGISLLRADMTDVQFTSYRLLTDQNGKAFQQAVCAYMKQNLAYEAAEAVYEHYNTARSAQDGTDSAADSIEKAQDALENPQNYETEPQETGSRLKGASSVQETDASAGVSTKAETADNPMDTVTEAQKDGVLALVLPEDAHVSGKSIALEQTVSHRTLAAGTMTASDKGGWYQKVLFDQYLIQYMSCYTQQKGERALQYELEYLLGGKAEDEANLKAAVTKLLALREAMNLTALAASSARQAEAYSYALLLAGASANPLVIEAVKCGILAAWAFAESVLDVRTLLSGGKIALVKTEADWTSNVSMLPELLSGYSVAKSSPQGLDYAGYMGILLLTQNADRLAQRAMDVQELYVRMQDGYGGFQMDHAVCEAELTATYEFSPVFLGFVTLLERKLDCFRLQDASGYSYFSGKEDL